MDQRGVVVPVVSVFSTEELKARFVSLSLAGAESGKKHHSHDLSLDVEPQTPISDAGSQSDGDEPVQFVTISEDVSLESGPASMLSPLKRFPPSTPEKEFSDDIKIPPISNTEACTAKPRVIFSLKQILENYDPTAMYVFDIDETLVMSLSHKSVSLTPIERKLIDAASKTQNGPLCEYVQLFVTERVRERLDAKVLVEGQETIELLHTLLDRGCWVFGLTSRYSTTVSRTMEMLRKLGIDFSRGSPLPTDLSLQDPGTQAVYSHGIIYSNAIDKGVVLNRFLENVLLRPVLERQEKFIDRKSEQKKAVIEGDDTVLRDGDVFAMDKGKEASLRAPSRIIFVDDRISNAESVQTGLHVAEKVGIPVQTFHYMGAYMAAAAAESGGATVSVATVLSTAQDGEICAPTIPATRVGFSQSSASTSACDTLSCLIDNLATFYRKTVQNNLPNVEELGGQLHTLLRQLGQDTPCQHIRRCRAAKKPCGANDADSVEGAQKTASCGESA